MSRGVSNKEVNGLFLSSFTIIPQAGQIVALHNAVRGRVARGEEPRGRSAEQ